jgi:carbon storage regulator CsrA
MLVLHRKTEGEIVCHTSDGTIRIKVLGCTGTGVKLGFDAPRKISIFLNEKDPYIVPNGGVDEQGTD